MLSSDVRMMHADQLVTAVENAGGKPPKVLRNILTGFSGLASTTDTAPSRGAALADAAAAGPLTDQLIEEDWRRQALAEHRQHLQKVSHRDFVKRFHKALLDGAADEILDSLRPAFNDAAKQLAEAVAVVDINATAEYFQQQASPEETAAWRSLQPTVRKLDAIGAVTRQFGIKASLFPLLEQPNLIDIRELFDEALFCTAGDIIGASRVFRARMADVRTSPWLRVTPKLLSVGEAKERLRVWAEATWAAAEAGRGQSGTLTDDGYVQDVRANPFALADV